MNEDSLDGAVALEVAEQFGLGDLAEAPKLAAIGWGRHNLLWRLHTTTGHWAVKEIGRQPARTLGVAITIEVAAHRAGIRCPRPVPSRSGSWTIGIAGRTFRCHEWVDGKCPAGGLSELDAFDGGEALGRLHSINLPLDSNIDGPNVWGESHWQGLATSARVLGLDWGRRLQTVIPAILEIEDLARAWANAPHVMVASHKDVRPDNTLRTAGVLYLVDWDAAGPSVRGREIAFALRFWDPHQSAFLRGYESVAGTVDLAEGDGEDGGLLWWLELNVRLAIEQPGTPERQQAVALLIADLFDEAPDDGRGWPSS